MADTDAPVLLEIPIPGLSNVVLVVKRAHNDAFLGVEDSKGVQIDAFNPRHLAFQDSEFIGRLVAWVFVLAREMASQGTPFGATGANQDLWLEVKKVTVPTPQNAVLTISVTASNSVSIPAGTIWSSDAGQRYTQNIALNFVVLESTIDVDITAVDIGSIFNLSTGDSVFVQAPPNDLVEPSVVAAIVTPGQNPADEAAKLALLKAAFGGDGGVGTIGWYQFELLALDLSISQVFVEPVGNGDGTAVLYPVMVQTDESVPDYVIVKPTQGQVDGWELVLRDPKRKVVRDLPFVEVLATPQIDLEFAILPNSAANQAAAITAVNERFQDARPTASNPMVTYSIAVSELVAAIGVLVAITSAVATDVQPGVDADLTNVPNPGGVSAGDAVVGVSGQILIGGIISFV